MNTTILRLVCFALLLYGGTVSSIFAGSITITSPSNGEVFYAPLGSSSALVWINQTWECSGQPYIGCHVRVYVDGNQISAGGYNSYYSIGTHDVRAELWETNSAGQQFKTTQHEISFVVKGTYSIVVRNSFNAGQVKVDGQVYSSGTAFTWRQDEVHTLEAISGQTTNQDGFAYTWNYEDWQKNQELPVSTNPRQISVDGDATYRSRFTGQITISGTHTIQSGQTGIVQPRTTVRFESGAKLMVYGRLIANGTSGDRITFTRSGSSGTWSGIELSGSGANNSSLQYCDINYARSPIVATSTTNLTISNCTIGNSSFYDDNFHDAAAIRLYGSSANITSTRITGNGLWGSYSASWNGIRFAQGSSGTVSGCTIENLGYGNGIVIQGGSNPLISNNTIRNNYYHGIIATTNDPGLPQILGNNVQSNGVLSGVKYYNGINFYRSSGLVRNNMVTGSNYGIYADTYASPYSDTYPVSEPGGNIIYSNHDGIVANNSYLWFGSYDPSSGYFYGACNHIYANDRYDVLANNAGVYVRGNWWGQAPPDQSRFYAHNGGWIDYQNWRPYADFNCWPDAGCPECPPGPLSIGSELSIARISEGMSSTGAEGFSEVLNRAGWSRFKKQFADAKNLYKNVLARSKKQEERQRALVGLLELFRDSNDESLLADVEQYGSAPGKTGIVANEILIGLYAATGRYAEAKLLARSHKTKHAGTEHEKFALIELVSLAAHTETERATAQAAFRELLQKYPDTDKGLLVAINPGVPMDGSARTASLELDGSELLANYPNPFNPSTTISFRVQVAGFTSLKVYDVLGREIVTLVNQQKEPGIHSVTWDAGHLPSGMYFYRLETAGKSVVRKMALVR